MKKAKLATQTLAMILLPLPLFGAKVAPLPALPQGALPNSEVVTNTVLNVDYSRYRGLTLALELNASESNSLTVAVGTAQGDSLSIEEADLEWGYDCGRWFRADTEIGIVEEWPAPGTGRVSRSLAIGRRDFNPKWNRLRIVKRGVGDSEVDASSGVEYKKFSITVR